ERAVPRSRARELKDAYFLEHELMISTTHIALKLATRASSVKLIQWRQGDEELTDSVDGLGERKFCPDAFFILEDSKRPVGSMRRRAFSAPSSCIRPTTQTARGTTSCRPLQTARRRVKWPQELRRFARCFPSTAEPHPAGK